MTFGKTITVQIEGFSDIVNITEEVQETVKQSKINQGIASVTAIGSTASITTIAAEIVIVPNKG